MRNVGLRHTGLLEEGAHSRRDVLADEVAHAASIHPEVVLPACEGRLAGRYTTSTRRDPDEVAVGPRKAAVSVVAPILSATAVAVGGWGESGVEVATTKDRSVALIPLHSSAACPAFTAKSDVASTLR